MKLDSRNLEYGDVNCAQKDSAFSGLGVPPRPLRRSPPADLAAQDLTIPQNTAGKESRVRSHASAHFYRATVGERDGRPLGPSTIRAVETKPEQDVVDVLSFLTKGRNL